jgi:hypothetical protein
MNSTLNPDNEPVGPDDENASRGRDGRALGPSDSSDSGSDTAGARRHPFDIDSPLDEHALERRGYRAGPHRTIRRGRRP